MALKCKTIKTHRKIKLKAFWFHFLTQAKHARRCLYKTVKFGIFSQIYIERLRKDFKVWKNLEILKLGGDWDELWTTIFRQSCAKYLRKSKIRWNWTRQANFDIVFDICFEIVFDILLLWYLRNSWPLVPSINLIQKNMDVCGTRPSLLKSTDPKLF